MGDSNFAAPAATGWEPRALMEGPANGSSIIPNTIGNYLASHKLEKVDTSHKAFKSAEKAVADRTSRFLSIKGNRTVASFHRELGRIMWDYCGMSRNEAGLRTALEKIPRLLEKI